MCTRRSWNFRESARGGKGLVTLDGRLWRRYFRLAVPYWRLDSKWPARGLLLLLVVLMLGNTGFSVLLNEQVGETTSALASRERDRFWTSIYKSAGYLCISVPLFACYYYVRDRLGNQWRRWMTSQFLNRYLSNRSYYRLVSDESIDNPDQRISEDINTFTQKSLYYLLLFSGATIQLAMFSGVLWSISKVLMVSLVVYGFVGTFIAVFVFGRRLTGLNFMQLRREADFRSQLIRIRENAESIAFYRGEEQEQAHAKRGFLAAFANYLKVIRWQFFLNFYQYGLTSLTTIIPSVVLVPQVFSGTLEVGRVVEAVGAFTMVFSAFTVIVENFESLSRFVAGVDRLSTFRRALDTQAAAAKAGEAIEAEEGSHLSLEDVTVQIPAQERALVKKLSVEVEPGNGLVIVGPSGSGKSSLLRAIAGLWTSGKGKIIRPGAEDMLFLPQSPYMVEGTLRRQLLYPALEEGVPDEDLEKVLKAVNLPDLIERSGGLDVELKWSKVLSIGEQQRLAIARVLLTKPQYVILDEATSALDLENEEKMYRKLHSNSMTLVSVCHRPSILKYHEQVLELSGKGKWKVYPSKEYTFSEGA
ncbi:MAG: ABC transporter ATP-binding protein/permease [Planctomycetia bacterium]|nr:ABC transporter ATP-binding protein/permease [Planctomycetia bacterium]